MKMEHRVELEVIGEFVKSKSCPSEYCYLCIVADNCAIRKKSTLKIYFNSWFLVLDKRAEIDTVSSYKNSFFS